MHDDGPFAVAPMMDYTDRFLRFLLRRLSVRQMLYTEMVVASTIRHADEQKRARYLSLSDSDEPPVTLQIGGSEPELLHAAAAAAAPFGYSALNLNCGCPSDRVSGKGRFGAVLMRDPSLVAACASALSEGVGGRLPVSVKCRVGIVDDARNLAGARAASEVDDERDYDHLCAFVDTVSRQGGVHHFVVHARKAVLGGLLSPAQNREIPPLRHDVVCRLARDFPALRFSLNGGIGSLAEASQLLSSTSLGGEAGDGQLAGVMVGRAVCARPWDWATVDTDLYGCASNPAASRRQVLEEFCAFAEAWEDAQGHTRARHLILKPALALFANEPKGKQFRSRVHELAGQKHGQGYLVSTADVLRQAAAEALLEETLNAPPGTVWYSPCRQYLSQAEVSEQMAARAASA